MESIFPTGFYLQNTTNSTNNVVKPATILNISCKSFPTNCKSSWLATSTGGRRNPNATPNCKKRMNTKYIYNIRIYIHFPCRIQKYKIYSEKNVSLREKNRFLAMVAFIFYIKEILSLLKKLNRIEFFNDFLLK